MTIGLRHGKIELALHELRAGSGRPLLLLHGLGERSPGGVVPELSAWIGPVFALDFTGHGESTVPPGGGYRPELLMADVDAALAHLGTATIVGRGLGAYVALLASGGRPREVRGAVLCDGPGLNGGGACATAPYFARVDPRWLVPPDPHAFIDLCCDPRPADYAVGFARLALERSGLTRPITVCASERPPWLARVVAEPGIQEQGDVEKALVLYASSDCAQEVSPLESHPDDRRHSTDQEDHRSGD